MRAISAAFALLRSMPRYMSAGPGYTASAFLTTNASTVAVMAREDCSPLESSTTSIRGAALAGLTCGDSRQYSMPPW